MADLSFSIHKQKARGKRRSKDKEYRINLQSRCHWFLIFFSLPLSGFPWKTVYDIGNDSNPFKHFKSRRIFSRFSAFFNFSPSISFWCVFSEEYFVNLQETDWFQWKLKVIDEITIKVWSFSFDISWSSWRKMLKIIANREVTTVGLNDKTQCKWFFKSTLSISPIFPPSRTLNFHREIVVLFEQYQRAGEKLWRGLSSH